MSSSLDRVWFGQYPVLVTKSIQHLEQWVISKQAVVYIVGNQVISYSGLRQSYHIQIIMRAILLRLFLLSLVFKCLSQIFEGLESCGFIKCTSLSS